MFNKRLLLATIVFSCVFLECYADAISCYNGGYFPTKQQDNWRELEFCGGGDTVEFVYVCVSFNARTNVTFESVERNETLLAGTWMKSCTKRQGLWTPGAGIGIGIPNIFGEDVSDGCKELKEQALYTNSEVEGGRRKWKGEGLKIRGKVDICICSTSECNGGIHAVLSTLLIFFAMTVAILTQ